MFNRSETIKSVPTQGERWVLRGHPNLNHSSWAHYRCEVVAKVLNSIKKEKYIPGCKYTKILYVNVVGCMVFGSIVGFDHPLLLPVRVRSGE